LRDVRFSIRSVAAAGVLAAITLAGQTAANAAAPNAATPNVAAQPDGAPGHWSQVTNKTTNIADVGLVRGADGVLHVMWEEGTINGHEGILDTPIAPSGAVGHAAVIVSGQTDASFPDATATPGGLDVFWNGTKTLTGPEGIFEATRPTRGGHWTLAPVTAQTLPSSSVTAATGSDGKPWISFTNTFHLELLHQGRPQDDVRTACCVSQPGIATDGVTGTSYVAYLSLIRNAQGIWLHRLNQAGFTGTAFRLPGSVTRGNTVVINQRAAITGHGKGRAGVYLAYGAGFPTYSALEVYRVGASKPFALAKFNPLGEHLAGMDITAGPNGRLWVTWIDGAGSPPALFVRASNSAATAWTTTARVPLPRGTQFAWKVYENAQAGKVDVVALLTVSGHLAFYATQVPLPPPPKK